MRMTQAEKNFYGYMEAVREPTGEEIRRQKERERNRIEAELIEKNPKLRKNPEELKEKVDEVMR